MPNESAEATATSSSTDAYGQIIEPGSVPAWVPGAPPGPWSGTGPTQPLPAVPRPHGDEYADTYEGQLLKRILEAITGLPSQLRQYTTDRHWAEIPFDVFEHGLQTAGTNVIVPPAVQDSVTIEGFYTFIGGGQTGWLQIGNTLLIPVPSGGFVLPYRMRLHVEASDTRQLSAGTPGGTGGSNTTVFLALFGSIAGRFGNVPR